MKVFPDRCLREALPDLKAKRFLQFVQIEIRITTDNPKKTLQRINQDSSNYSRRTLEAYLDIFAIKVSPRRFAGDDCLRVQRFHSTVLAKVCEDAFNRAERDMR
jgi:hypothetical protein